MIVLLSIKNDLINLLTWSITFAVWPDVTVRIIPGRSTTVKSHASGETRSITMLSIENCEVPSQSVLVRRSMTELKAVISVTGYFLAGFDDVDTEANHDSSARAFRMTSRIGHRVTSPELILKFKFCPLA